MRVWGRTACARSSADACGSESALWNQWFLLRAIHVRQTHCGQEFQQRFRGCPSLGGRARLPSEVLEIFYSSIYIVVTQVYASVKGQRSVYLRFVHCVSKLILSEK